MSNASNRSSFDPEHPDIRFEVHEISGKRHGPCFYSNGGGPNGHVSECICGSWLFAKEVPVDGKSRIDYYCVTCVEVVAVHMAL